MPHCIKVPYFSALSQRFGCVKPKLQIEDECKKSPSSSFGLGETHVFSQGEYTYIPVRTKLPAVMTSRSEVSFWSVLKQCIGKELSKITMPVVFNEPLSLIQRLAEYMEYGTLIETASQCDDPIERMEFVAAFAVSALSSNWSRIGKPFNPLLGETYELCRPDLGFRFIGEQVSHHPPITAFRAEGRYYTFYGSVQPKLKFWGKTVEITPKGLTTLILHKYRETYTWQNVNCIIHNVMVGNLWVEHTGIMEISCNKSNISATLNFKSGGWFGKDLHHVEGCIYIDKEKVRAVYGSWVLGIYSCSAQSYEACITESTRRKSTEKDPEYLLHHLLSYKVDVPDQKTLWKGTPRPPYSSDYYEFSIFSLSLNELLPGMKEKLPPTDSRLRPDIVCMEKGELNQASLEKNRMEEKQRGMREEMKKAKKERKPQWFGLQKNSSTAKEEWVFINNYWKRDWSNSLDIF